MTQIIKGSIGEISRKNNKPLAVNFLNVKAFVMVDVSYSMVDNDAGLDASGKPQSRWQAAREQLADLQNQNPGEIAVGCFSDKGFFCPSGVPVEPLGGTVFVSALNLLKQADGTDIRLIIISDGEPHDETAALALAAKFSSKLDTIFVGSETGRGRDFLRRLSMQTGGISITNETSKLNLLSENITHLLAA